MVLPSMEEFGSYITSSVISLSCALPPNPFTSLNIRLYSSITRTIRPKAVQHS